jgi:hypothetical protein
MHYLNLKALPVLFSSWAKNNLGRKLFLDEPKAPAQTMERHLASLCKTTFLLLDNTSLEGRRHAEYAAATTVQTAQLRV